MTSFDSIEFQCVVMRDSILQQIQIDKIVWKMIATRARAKISQFMWKERSQGERTTKWKSHYGFCKLAKRLPFRMLYTFRFTLHELNCIANQNDMVSCSYPLGASFAVCVFFMSVQNGQITFKITAFYFMDIEQSNGNVESSNRIEFARRQRNIATVITIHWTFIIIFDLIAMFSGFLLFQLRFMACNANALWTQNSFDFFRVVALAMVSSWFRCYARRVCIPVRSLLFICIFHRHESWLQICLFSCVGLIS